MNYRHSFHAGNSADVVKHSLLIALVRALQIKESALTSRVHALRAGGASLNTILTTLKNEGHAVTRSWVARRCAGMVP